jgi:hypothetical protein
MLTIGPAAEPPRIRALAPSGAATSFGEKVALTTGNIDTEKTPRHLTKKSCFLQFERLN